MVEVIALLAIPALITCLFVGAWILWPLDEVASHRRRRVQFTVIDFLGLVFLLQLPMALINLGIDSSTSDGMFADRLTLYILAWIATSLVWWRSVVVFSRAGVTETRDRALTVFLVLPMAYLGTFSIPVLIAAAALGSNSTPWRIGLMSIAAAIMVGVVSAGVVSRKVADRSACRQERTAAQRQADDPVLAELVEPSNGGRD